MSNKKVIRYKKLLKETSDEDLLFLIKHSYVNAVRQNESAKGLYPSTFRESSYNLFYISAEEFYKSLRLMEYYNIRKAGQIVDDKLIDDLAKLFVFHKFKMEGSKEKSIEAMERRAIYVTNQDKPHLDKVEEGKKMKKRELDRMRRYSSDELFDLKNESLYVGFKEQSDELSSPIENFHFRHPDTIMKFISELSFQASKKVYELIPRDEIKRLVNYRMLIGTKHSD